jgi:hypothetical protein
MADISAAISLFPKQSYLRLMPNISKLYSLRAKILFQAHRYEEAVADLEQAIRQNPEQANGAFETGDTTPLMTHSPCYWTQPELVVCFKQSVVYSACPGPA